VGEAGQARIARARVVVHSKGLAAEVAARYLAGAGVAEVRMGCGEAPGASVTLPLDDPSARAVAQGAMEALEAIKAALAEGT